MNRLGAAAATSAAVAGVAHAAPAVLAWRALRCRITPALAGIGRADHVALTFDDGPDSASTPVVLDALDRLGWKATFFLLGPNARCAPSLARELVERGHEVAVHGERHDSHLTRFGWDSRSDIGLARDTVADAAGAEPVWFRPPYGTLSTPVLLAARRLGLRTVLWTAWGRDWRAEATPASVTADVTAGLEPGATVLLHDSDCTSAPGSWRSTVGALPMLADVFADRGLTVGPLRDHAIATTGAFNGAPPADPSKGANPKLKMPPSAAANQ